VSAEEILHQHISEDAEPIPSLAQAVIQRLHAADGSGADELLSAQDTQALRDLRQAGALLESPLAAQRTSEACRPPNTSPPATAEPSPTY
jgi:hypothetical protein